MAMIISEILGLKFKYFANDTMGAHSIGLNKEWESHIRKFTQLYNSLYQIKNILDIGANFGYHSLLFSRECTENVFAFEPQKQNYDLLTDNIQLNNITNVVVYNYACGDKYCDVKMPVIDCSTTVNMGDITPNMDCNDNFTVTKSIVLDDCAFYSKIDLIKLDVQGWEMKVLLGAKKLMQTHKPVMIVEFEYFQLMKTNTTCAELFNFIREQNYYIFYLEYSYPSDHICVHNEHLEDFRLKFKNYIFPHAEINNINYNVFNGINEKIVI